MPDARPLPAHDVLMVLRRLSDVRMHLLEPARPDLPYLLRALYGLLMLLPQGPAFRTLCDRYGERAPPLRLPPALPRDVTVVSLLQRL
jgi:hypothetical protein